ncbi:hypothetical protein GUJ93_ZPchr0009g1585 [Zizania palustris]|uniref:Uncharacterized protein n=1 Tax=Zizania palustris TaxID=103762 RepID=A0A8J5RZP6_ZIZPA|nr:hypothetical protein GUJ93_ZPchr0009g1585 [Zizania palustris]
MDPHLPAQGLASAARGLSSAVAWGSHLRRRPLVRAFVADTDQGPFNSAPTLGDLASADRRHLGFPTGLRALMENMTVLNQAPKQGSGPGFGEIR